MAEKVSLTAVLSVKDNMSSTLKGVGNSVGGLGGKFTSLIGAGAALQVGMKAVSAAMGVVSSSISSAVSRYDQLNNFPKVMNNLGIATKDTNAALKTLDKGITGLPTTMDAATQGVTKFVSKNNDIKKSTKYFLAMNNAITAGGASAQIQSAAVEQLSQAYSKGKMDMEEWRSLQTAMPAQLNMVAKAMGKTTDALGEGLRNGTISMDEFMDTMVRLNDEGIDGLASFEKQAKSATGGIATSITNLKTSVTRGMASCIEAIDTMLKKNGLPTIAESAQLAAKKVDAAFKTIAGAIKKVNIKGIIEGLAPAFTVLKTAASAAYKVLSKVLGFLNNHAEGVTKVATALAGLAVAYAGFKKISGFFSMLKGGTQEVKKFGKPADLAAEGTYKLKSGLGALSKMAGVAAIIASLALLAIAFEKLGSLGTTAIAPLMTFGVVVGGLAAVFAALGSKLQSSVAGIIVFAAAIAVMALAMAPIAQAGAQATTNMLVFGVVIAGLVAVFAIFGSALEGAMVPMIVFAAVVLAVGAALKLATPFITAFTGLIKQLGQTVSTILSAAASAVTQFCSAISSGFATICDAVATVINAISGGFTSVLNAAANVIDSIGNAAKRAGQGFKSVAEGIQTIAKLSIWELTKSLTAVAVGLGEISSKGANLPQVAAGMQALVMSLTLAAASITIFTTSLASLATLATTASTAVNAIKAAFAGFVITPPDISLFIAAFAAITAMAQQLVPALTAAGMQAGLGLASGLSAGASQASTAVAAAAAGVTVVLAALAVQLGVIGKAAGTNYSSGLKAGLNRALSAAKQIATQISTTLRSAQSGAYSAGRYIGIGLANGMLSQVGAVRAAAAQLAAAAEKAIEAKAKIGSPSKITDQIGRWWGEGFVNGIESQIRSAKDASKNLVSVPDISAPSFAGSHAGLAGVSEYSGGSFTVEVPVMLEGREISRVVAPFMQGDLNKLNTRESRKRGKR